MIPHSSSSLGAAERAAVDSCLEQNYVGPGPQSLALEKAVLQRTGRRHAFAVSSGFHALSLALAALDLPAHSEIALPILTCGSIPAAAIRAGHLPRLCDIHAENLTLDAETIPSAVRAVIAPHAYGCPVDVQKLQELGLPWIEDCATSPATQILGKPAGAFGTLAIFSFNSTKYITGGSGGMVVTDDDLLAQRLNDLLQENATVRASLWQNPPPPAWPGRLADLNAALALTQWQRLEEFRQHRAALAALYRERFKNAAPALRLPKEHDGHSYYRFWLRTQTESKLLVPLLRERGIDARDQINPWLDTYLEAKGHWPGADSMRAHLLSLPIHAKMTLPEAEDVAKSLLEIAVRLS
jgi:perosamine synthetase